MNPQGGGLPHDIRGLLPYHTPWWEYALWGLAAVAVAAALLLLARFLMNRQRQSTAQAVDPWVGLRHRLGQLKAAEPFPTKAQEDFFYTLSLLLREGIELRTTIPATDRTFRELREPLRRKLPLATKEVESLLGFLELADMIKFAGVPSSVDEAQACLTAVEGWVHELKPKHAEDNPFHGLPTTMQREKRLEMG